MTDHTILWRRLDAPGHESCRCFATDSGRRLEGAAVFAHDGAPCSLDYTVACDAGWLNGAECPGVRGCTDLDLNFSPSTNLLPIRRLGLAIGQEARVRAAWLRFPGFTLEPLEQRYRRLAADTYRYESLGSGFSADLRVNAAGLVTLYPGFFDAEPAGRAG